MFNLRKVIFFNWNKVVENTATKHTSISFFPSSFARIATQVQQDVMSQPIVAAADKRDFKTNEGNFDNFTSAVMCYSAAILNSPTVISRNDATCLARTWTRRVYLLAWSYTRNYHGYILRIGAKCSSSAQIHTRCSAETIAITMQIVIH